MISKGTGFAKYTKSLCAVVSFIWMLVAIMVYTGDSENAAIKGSLWLFGSLALAISAIFSSRKTASEQKVVTSEPTSE